MSYTKRFRKDFPIPLNVEVEEPSVSIDDVVLPIEAAYITDSSGNRIVDSGGRRVEISANDIKKFISIENGRVEINFNGDRTPIDIGASGKSHRNRDLTHDETVQVNIEVDTDPFDESVSKCNNHINLLTGSVAATEAAQVASINENSKQIASTIITGFFKNVQAEISTKILELSQKVEARLMHLYEQKKRLVALKEQLENDYQRRKSDYTKIITDLNKELENRVKAIDEPVFKMSALIEKSSKRMTETGSAEVASIVAKENSILTSQIQAALTKKKAQQTMVQATDFLSVQRGTDNAIRQSSITKFKADNSIFFLPVCYFETTDSGNIVNQSCVYSKKHLPDAVDKKIADDIFLNNGDGDSGVQKQESVDKFFNAIMQNAHQNIKNEHDTRVINTINKLYIG
ncbi:MAG: hypothetical protein IJ911_02105 [Salinivirgaceae bacterium]|nr:hypothetical protein [Salinivirgaceae bacterium]